MFSLSSGGVIGASSTKSFGKYAIDGAATTAEAVIAISTHNIDRNLDGLTKNELIKAIVADCSSEKKRKNGRTDRRILITPNSEISRLLSVEQMLSFAEVVVAEILPNWKGYLICHIGKDEQKHVHGVFSVNNIEEKRIDVSAKELEKMHKKYNELLEENFPEQMAEYREKMKEKIENMTIEEKVSLKETGLMKGNTSIKKRKIIKNEQGEIEVKVEKSIKKYKTEAEAKGIFTIAEARIILRNAMSTTNVLDQETFLKIVKTLNHNRNSEYNETKKGKQFVEKLENDLSIFISVNKAEKVEQEKDKIEILKEKIEEEKVEIEKLKEEWKEKVKAVTEYVSIQDVEDYNSEKEE